MKQSTAIILEMAMVTALTFGAGSASTAKPAPNYTIYVSPSGSDQWSGLRKLPNRAGTDGPVASLDAARDHIRKMREARGLPNGGIRVEIEDGRYELDHTFVLNSGDSGTEKAPIIYEAAKGQSVHFIGGKKLSGFKPVTDSSVLQKLDPSARGHVMCVDLKQFGIREFPAMKSASSWAQSEAGLELFCDDQPMTLACWPNTGFTNIVDVKGAHEMDIRGTKGTVEGVFTYEGDRPSRWLNEPELMAEGYWMWDWADQRYRVQSIDTSTKTITLEDKPVHPYGFRKGQWYYIYNALCELDSPGEWYLDRQNGVLYFWPPKPVDQATVMVSVLKDMVNMTGVSYVSLRGITLECAQRNGINITGGEQCRIAKCTIKNLGSSAVNISGGKHHQVFGCDLYNLGDGGINLSGGDRASLTPSGHVVEDCHIYKFARWNPLYHPGISMSGVGIQVKHNLINDAPHMAILFSGNDHIIEYNEIHSVVYGSNDAGAIYCGRNWTMRGNKIRNNYIHDLYGYKKQGCVGVYLDDQFCSANIYGNVYVRVTNASFIGGGRDSTIENNIYIDCSPAIHVDARGLGWAASSKEGHIQSLNEMPYTGELWRSRYPELVNILNEEPMSPHNIKVQHNIAVGGKWSDIEGLAKPGVIESDNLISGESPFVDVDKLDFRLKAASPAKTVGFKPIPFQKIGLYKHADRASWPVKTSVRLPD